VTISNILQTLHHGGKTACIDKMSLSLYVYIKLILSLPTGVVRWMFSAASVCHFVCQLVSWSLTSLFSTNMAISETTLCLSVNTITSERLNVWHDETWPLGALYKNIARVRIWGSYRPHPWVLTPPKYGDLLSHYAKNQQTDVFSSVKFSSMFQIRLTESNRT